MGILISGRKVIPVHPYFRTSRHQRCFDLQQRLLTGRGTPPREASTNFRGGGESLRALEHENFFNSKVFRPIYLFKVRGL